MQTELYSIKKAELPDKMLWLKMRSILWPDANLAEHEKEIDHILQDDSNFVAFLAINHEENPVAFAEVSMRSYANGCESKPVAFLEGIWVAEPYRQQGIAKKLIDAAADWSRSKSCYELGSDTELHNQVSFDAHLKWGFKETERVIYFRKLLHSD